MFRNGVAKLYTRQVIPKQRIEACNVAHATPTLVCRRLPNRARSLHQARSIQTHSSFEPLRPPSPSSLGKPQAARDFKRSRKWGRRLLIFSAITGTIYVIDNQAFAAGIRRSLFTFGTGLWVALDYKINFRPEPLTGGTIEDLHMRSAEKLFHLLRSNGGLYLKIGQAIAMQSAVMPPEFQKMFSRMFDDAPQDEWKDVEKVVRKDFGGKSVEEVFGVSFTGEEGKGLMERRARASASVAQVHWARLPDGREVAIKLQKPEIAKQVGWDLWAFKVVMRIYTWWFDLPLYSLVPYITERLMLETDFEEEAKNSEMMRSLVNSEPSLKGRVYIPQVYSEFTTRRVLVTEWIEGVRLWDKDATGGRWLGGSGVGSPGVHGAQLHFGPSDMAAARQELRVNPMKESLKPDRETWKGRTGKAELVLIDHGLYVYMTPKFRHQYALLWKSLLTFDNKTIADVTAQWGIKAPDLFASATLLRPYEGGDQTTRSKIMKQLEGKTPSERHYEAQRMMKQGIREVLSDEEKWPQELVFIGRNMRIVQGNNQFMGSPVNRVKIMGNWASRSLFQDPNLPFRDRMFNAWRHLLFKTILFATDVAFYTFKVRQWLGLGGGMEDEVEARMREMAKDYGVELQQVR
ncbi:ABC1 family protein C10F6.14c [Daldinia childiae]|uniref:ABC1 family protein C10F6.14c n=1 Tax=Daldinia childiae TaxID=326645 RepID=UPI001445E447|nr:ABC1 family protein C10F6.14c [Daldinia childiae]KAF3055005.1 ABC1 family protein C10F6.14c [Daldinia childiae]